MRTFLPWVPASPTSARPASPGCGRWSVAPSRLADGTYADDSLATEMAPGGRLDRLVERGGELATPPALTWVVDPELLETAADMADGYRVRTRTGRPGAGAGTVWPADWLER